MEQGAHQRCGDGASPAPHGEWVALVVFDEVDHPAVAREASRRFHERLGFVGRMEKGFLGEGVDRIVFERGLPLPSRR